MIEVINISSILIKTVSGINPFNYQLMKYKVIYLTATLKVAHWLGMSPAAQCQSRLAAVSRQVKFPP